MKEYLATILEQARPDEAAELLNQWLEWAARSHLTPFVKLARTIRKHAAGILAYLDTRMTNGPVEGINNKLRVTSHGAPTASTPRSSYDATSTPVAPALSEILSRSPTPQRSPHFAI